MISLLIYIVVSPNVKRMNHASRRAGEKRRSRLTAGIPVFESQGDFQKPQGTLQGGSPPIEATKNDEGCIYTAATEATYACLQAVLYDTVLGFCAGGYTNIHRATFRGGGAYAKRPCIPFWQAFAHNPLHLLRLRNPQVKP